MACQAKCEKCGVKYYWGQNQKVGLPNQYPLNDPDQVLRCPDPDCRGLLKRTCGTWNFRGVLKTDPPLIETPRMESGKVGE